MGWSTSVPDFVLQLFHPFSRPLFQNISPPPPPPPDSSGVQFSGSRSNLLPVSGTGLWFPRSLPHNLICDPRRGFFDRFFCNRVLDSFATTVKVSQKNLKPGGWASGGVFEEAPVCVRWMVHVCMVCMVYVWCIPAAFGTQVWLPPLFLSFPIHSPSSTSLCSVLGPPARCRAGVQFRTGSRLCVFPVGGTVMWFQFPGTMPHPLPSVPPPGAGHPPELQGPPQRQPPAGGHRDHGGDVHVPALRL